MTIENLIIYTYNKAVETAEELQNDLDCRRIASSAPGAARTIPDGTLIVNWGYGRVPDWIRGRRGYQWLNNPTNVARKMSKIYQLHQFREAGVPTFDVTTSRAEVQRWLGAGERVLCRQDEAARGMGIAVIERQQDIPGGTDFYTKWFDKTHEFRFHVFRNQIIDVVQKKRLYAARPLRELSLTEQTVRNFKNGWIEAHKDLHLPGNSRDTIARAAVDAVRCLGLDFGAVDIVCKFSGRTLESLAVCEVNTAPGLGEIEREAYVNAIKAVHNAGL
jgi:hypothetical protein